MPSVSATLRHLNAQGLGRAVVRESLRQMTDADGGRGRSSPHAALPAAETGKFVSFSDVAQLRNATPEFVGTRSSRYDIKARRRAAERRKQRVAESPAADAGGKKAAQKRAPCTRTTKLCDWGGNSVCMQGARCGAAPRT